MGLLSEIPKCWDDVIPAPERAALVAHAGLNPCIVRHRWEHLLRGERYRLIIAALELSQRWQMIERMLRDDAGSEVLGELQCHDTAIPLSLPPAPVSGGAGPAKVRAEKSPDAPE